MPCSTIVSIFTATHTKRILYLPVVKNRKPLFTLVPLKMDPTDLKVGLYSVMCFLWWSMGAVVIFGYKLSNTLCLSQMTQTKFAGTGLQPKARGFTSLCICLCCPLFFCSSFHFNQIYKIRKKSTPSSASNGP